MIMDDFSGFIDKNGEFIYIGDTVDYHKFYDKLQLTVVADETKINGCYFEWNRKEFYISKSDEKFLEKCW